MLIYAGVTIFYLINGILCLLGKGYIQKDYRNRVFTEEYRQKHGESYILIAIPGLVYCFLCLMQRKPVISIFLLMLVLPGILISVHTDLKYLRMTMEQENKDS